MGEWDPQIWGQRGDRAELFEAVVHSENILLPPWGPLVGELELLDQQLFRPGA